MTTPRQDATLANISEALIALGFERIDPPFNPNDTRVWFRVDRSSLRSFGPTDPSVKGRVFIVIDELGGISASGHPANATDETLGRALFANDNYWPHGDALSLTAVLLQLSMHLIGQLHCERHCPRREPVKLTGVWITANCWELRNGDGAVFSTASRSCTPDEALAAFQAEFPAANIEMDTRDYDAHQDDLYNRE